MSNDLTNILAEWEYDPDTLTRIIVADDGRSVIQVRRPLGIDQYELTGRPDGKRPMDADSVVDAVERRLGEHVETAGSESGFVLTDDECDLLQEEGMLYYYRYLMLFQLSRFESVADDTEHNLRLCRLLDRYCDEKEKRDAVLQFRPYIVRMNAVARSMVALQEGKKRAAETVLAEAIARIEELEEIDSPAFQFERLRSLKLLSGTISQVRQTPAGPVDELQRELDAAVEKEDYERAAELRDRIRAMHEDAIHSD